jgi:hypothetical protein
MIETLEKKFDYYLAHQDELVEKYANKVIVIKDKEVIGVYDTDLEAVTETAKEYELDTFLVQKAEPGSSSYRQSFHSRGTFAYAQIVTL